MDQQTKNRRIHELMGRGSEWHPFDEQIIAGEFFNCSTCGVSVMEHIDNNPDYYSDENPRHARKALAFAVEQKGVQAVGSALLDAGMSYGFAGMVAAALAPPSVLCDAALAVLEEK